MKIAGLQILSRAQSNRFKPEAQRRSYPSLFHWSQLAYASSSSVSASTVTNSSTAFKSLTVILKFWNWCLRITHDVNWHSPNGQRSPRIQSRYTIEHNSSSKTVARIYAPVQLCHTDLLRNVLEPKQKCFWRSRWRTIPLEASFTGR